MPFKQRSLQGPCICSIITPGFWLQSYDISNVMSDHRCVPQNRIRWLCCQQWARCVLSDCFLKPRHRSCMWSCSDPADVMKPLTKYVVYLPSVRCGVFSSIYTQHLWSKLMAVSAKVYHNLIRRAPFSTLFWKPILDLACELCVLHLTLGTILKTRFSEAMEMTRRCSSVSFSNYQYMTSSASAVCSHASILQFCNACWLGHNSWGFLEVLGYQVLGQQFNVLVSPFLCSCCCM